jgi:hypothetical protein
MDPSPASISTLKAPDEARKAVEELVQRFAANAHLYTGNSYNETQVRQEFINPFFEALGWDVSNKTGAYEAFKDVVHEDALKVGDSNRAPDYSFRFGGQRVFFVEAKKPAVAVKADVQPAFQLRRYAWSAGLPVSILTDFEEFAVYDTRQKPDRKDDAAVARALYVRYDQYLAELDRLYAIFSKEAVRTGGLHRFAADTRGKRGTTEVSSEFLRTIESWRDGLAREIALRNPDLADHELNHAVQATIDRILFLRIAEDRGIEPADTLHDLADKPDAYPALCDLFRRADERYNAGLFNFGPQGDQVCLNLQINDKPLREILKGLYYPVCPYEFSVIPGDILGAVYEQFLGKVIRLTAGHRAKVEDKPEVRKAGGVYYTPRYIVDYIVEHTVGASLAQQKAPAKLTVLDPACGSGSFLLGAYEYLLDWHLKAYVAEDPDSFCRGKSAPLVKLGPGDYRLSLAERRRILTDCLFGVDLDPQAVEVTKLNLLLKCMEGENEQTLQPRLLGHERVLPNIDRNIKCGNSLIGWDYFEGQLMPEAAEIRRVRPFDWDSEFAEIMGSGGFDCVIGNPPYIRIQNLREFSPEQPPYFKAHYRAAAKGNYDIYVVFVEKGLSLLNPTGRLGMILPHKFFNAAYGEGLRGLIAGGQHLEHVVHFGDQQVFADATTYTCLLFLSTAAQQNLSLVRVRKLSDWVNTPTGPSLVLGASVCGTGHWDFAGPGPAAELGSIGDGLPRLGALCDRIAQGIRTSANEVFVVELTDGKAGDSGSVRAFSEALGVEVELEGCLLLPFLRGRDIRSYALTDSAKGVIVPYTLRGGKMVLLTEDQLRGEFPLTWAYLSANRPTLEAREKGRMRGPGWYGYVYPKNLEVMTSPKLLVPDITDKAAAAIDAEGVYAFTSGYGITLRPEVTERREYVLGLLNSRLVFGFLTSVTTRLQNGFYRYFSQYLERLPIRPVDFSNPEDVVRHDRMVGLVQTMLDLHKRLPEAKTATDRDLIQRQIDATDKQIDALVYELYGLTEEEIAIVEGTAQGD